MEEEATFSWKNSSHRTSHALQATIGCHELFQPQIQKLRISNPTYDNEVNFSLLLLFCLLRSNRNRMQSLLYKGYCSPL